MASFDYDTIIIGSGFGGSVAALRLSEQGQRVAVLEQGRRITPEDMQRAAKSPLDLFWLPGLGLRGFFTQHIFQHVTIVGGVGVGGGSLVYAAVLLEPRRDFFADPAWNGLGVDWEAELLPHYQTAATMLGRRTNPGFHQMDVYLQQTAQRMGAADTYSPAPVGIYFGASGQTDPDPYFAGRGPERAGCQQCGECLTGCPHNAKNSLDKNYLYLAERLGAQVLPEHRARLIRPRAGGGYEVESVHPLHRHLPYPMLSAPCVIISAGVLGTLELLFRCRDVYQTLPAISPRLGEVVRTNSEAVVGILANDPQADLSQGTTISSHFYLGEHTHITQNRFPEGYTFMKWYTGPLVDGADPVRRAMRTLGEYLHHPGRSTASWRAERWHKRISALTVMQHADNQISLRYGRSPFTLLRQGLQSGAAPGQRAPTYLPEANRAARLLAEVSRGLPQNTLLESMLNMSVTAHILGGAPIGANPDQAVIDSRHEVFGYPGLFVVDGSAIPANVGVNPSLTITALAERCLQLME